MIRKDLLDDYCTAWMEAQPVLRKDPHLQTQDDVKKLSRYVRLHGELTHDERAAARSSLVARLGRGAWSDR